MGDALALGRELSRRDQIDVQTAVTVEVDERDAAARRFQDVVFRGSATVGLRRKTTGLLERDRRGARRPARILALERGPSRTHSPRMTVPSAVFDYSFP